MKKIKIGKLRENEKSDVKVGADECFLIVTFIFQNNCGKIKKVMSRSVRMSAFSS